MDNINTAYVIKNIETRNTSEKYGLCKLNIKTTTPPENAEERQ